MTNQARRLLARARHTQYGWKSRDLERLYRAFGFEVREGSDRRLYWHPLQLDLTATVTRSSRSLHPDYVRHAIHLI